jgi:transcriptional regulator with XRE-family HTH domain
MASEDSPLRVLREELGLTATELALVCGVTVAEISRAECGAQSLPRKLGAFLDRLGWPSAELRQAHEEFQATRREQLTNQVRERASSF